MRRWICSGTKRSLTSVPRKCRTAQGDGRKAEEGRKTYYFRELSVKCWVTLCALGGSERALRCNGHPDPDLCIMTWLLGYVDLSEPHFVAAVLAIVFNPLFWNVVARWEHKTRKLSKAFGSPRLACYTLGGAILLLNVLRSHCFTQAMLSQPRMQSLDNPAAYHVGLALLGVGGVFVLSSFLALGFTGTFLGDYFGILKEARVTMFPFSVLDNPMYWGSTAIYLGWAIVHASPTGLLLTAVVALIYMVAIVYEEPFTAEIYQQKASQAYKRS
ncbi:phosphatidylethanolamine N-methyltransferase isoform X1 [Bubalus bubalis]|uniref:phosphatidylethanolamine N-methyltransferase isoform X1 n=2 Tax=Bubalus bubalis TaxID=89462 RepID=UPI000DBCA3D1|nr:phosphatidylethanolamine N-methyltransferase isoform X1 [Bubalus bubalis]